MEFVLKPFKDLSNTQVFDLYKLRSEVFVVEQKCAYQDPDDKDLRAFHLMLYEENTLCAYCRILPPAVSYPEPSIGRVVVSSIFRGKNFGKLLMKQSIKQTLELFKNQQIVISAQCYLIKFYNDLHFETEGEEYLEDNIPHVKMRYNPL